ncbi:MAG: 4Fe-4S binding protein [Culturomica sp.]|jgi:NADH-quinone oxidoreductase subunit I|nr:4Fe-4S binding protein [Culturomica sp.]
MNSIKNYLHGFFSGLGSLTTGMKTTLRIFFRKKVTEKYPENRATLKIAGRFRGELIMPHNERNEHNCIACGICEMNCPNSTIRIVSEMQPDEAGKNRKVLTAYHYDLGSCLFCQLCVQTCPQNAIRFLPTFEHAVFTREKLFRRLNREGSRLMIRPQAPAGNQ